MNCGLRPAFLIATRVLWSDAGVLASRPAVATYLCIRLVTLLTSWPLNRCPRALATVIASLWLMRAVFASTEVLVNFMMATDAVVQ